MTVKDPSDDSTSPAVLAYRVGQLEKTVATGFIKLENKLELMQANFVRKDDLVVLEKQATTEHDDIRKELAEVRSSIHEITQWKDQLIAKIAGAAIIVLVLMVLAVYGLDKFIRL